jgi:potassium-transporting ATPase KdpC subunit
VTASAGGLDPDISVAAAECQIERVARARGTTQAAIRAMVARHVAPRQFGILGMERVCVLSLNLSLDEIDK